MIDKRVATAHEAVADIRDGATVMIHGFGNAGMPAELIDALIAQGARDLTIVNNNAGNADTGLAALIKAKRVRKILCSFPRQADSWHFDKLYRAGEIELELVPQGTLAERIRAAGAGIGAFYTPTAYGTKLAEGKETRHINGRDYVLEYPIHADYALIKADRADRWGNLTYRKSARNFGRRVRESRHRAADDGRGLSAEGPRDHPAQRERHPRRRAEARGGRRGRGPHQRRQGADHARHGRVVLPPRRFVRDDPRAAPRLRDPRRLPGLARRRPRELA